jgi:toxin ParE1/3/4
MKIRYLPRAFADLEAIHSYISKHNRAGALQVTAAVTTSILGLVDFPDMGQPADAEDVRVLRSAHHTYNIFYSVKGEEIQVLHIRHQARKPPTKEEL